jgi:two-component system, chemotaxis family, CheB/CheR fusion protein
LKKSRTKVSRQTAPEDSSGRAAAFPIVGIGASAGGLAAFEAFFAGMPADRDPGMAFVLVQHLAPDHKSILADLIQRRTHMAVHEVTDGMGVQPNCVYIIPPAHDMALLNGRLQLLKPSAARGHRLPIDFFFCSLAQDQHERTIGIILSGTGTDGTLGARAIKGENGLVLAQNPESVEFDGMPRSAIATGLVDYVMPPAEMPAKLIAYIAHLAGRRPLDLAPPTETGNSLRKIFLQLRTQTGHDFSLYKPSTIHRRIERRMALHQIDQLDDYVAYLSKSPEEVESLFRDLLINVTRFFRDPEAFAVVEKQVIARLFEERPSGSPLRLWVVGCSTGEEAYSLAILLTERMETLKRSQQIQLFATDIDSRAIAAARAGIYPASISVDVSPERLARFFTPDPDGSVYRINKSIRDMLVFSEHDVIKDPPFSKLDLISCRNLLIYLTPELQQKVIRLLHYALNPGGILFLGNSEGVGESSTLFAIIDAKAKLYHRTENGLPARRPTLLPSLFPNEPAPFRDAIRRPLAAAKTPVRELTERELLNHAGLVGALVNAQGDIFYLHGRAGLYLEPTSGEPGISNVLKMAREGLRPALAAALRKAVQRAEVVQGDEVVRTRGVPVTSGGRTITAHLTVRPVTGGKNTEPPLFLVILEEPAAATPAARAGGAQPASLAALRQELQAKDEYLRGANEQLQIATEELQSSNEEMQSVNEELQSTNEELETSKEELQSVNEELNTVNTELQTKVLSLSRANNDMNNLLAGTDIGTVFVDHQLRIMRFTPAASSIINLILSDVGRPVSHLVSNLVGYDHLVADTKGVLDTLVPKETEVKTTDGKFFTLRIQPYRTLENVIEGAVISFIDITAMVKIREELRQANDLLRLAVVVRDAHDAITVQALDGRTLAWNPGAARMYGWTEAEALQMKVADRVPESGRAEELAKLARLAGGEIMPAYQSARLTKDGATVEVEVTATTLLNAEGQIYAIATTELCRPETK